MTTKRKVKSKSRKSKSRRTKSKPKSRPAKSKKSKSKKKAFGGYSIKFAGRQETLEQVFGRAPIAPSLMTKKIWAFVKAKKLGST